MASQDIELRDNGTTCDIALSSGAPPTFPLQFINMGGADMD